MISQLNSLSVCVPPDMPWHIILDKKYVEAVQDLKSSPTFLLPVYLLHESGWILEHSRKREEINLV
jgi:hypothetical protein